MTREKLNLQQHIEFSPELIPLISRLRQKSLVSVNPHLTLLLDHLTEEINSTLTRLESNNQQPIFVAGPDWCRQNADRASHAHAQIIIDTYGSTYALPNKDPQANHRALEAGNLDMYLLFQDNQPIGTACMVIQADGWAELGRAASRGGVGNKLIQDLRIVDWLTNPEFARSTFGIFATCRTAPDREIGTPDHPQIMRGGQAVTHMWAKMPHVRIAGFGPMYKKHGALEQFAYTIVTNRPSYLPHRAWVLGDSSWQFVHHLADHYKFSKFHRFTDKVLPFSFTPHYPPLESGITQLVHGEISLSSNEEQAPNGQTTLEEAIGTLEKVEVPFIQVPVPIDSNTLAIQQHLTDFGFQPFMATPGIHERQSPYLWYGRVRPGIPVVPTYWDHQSIPNPFYPAPLATLATTIASRW